MLSQVHDAIITVDLHGLISSWNDAAARMYGFTSAEAIGRTPRALIQDRWLDGQDDRHAVSSLQATGSWRGELSHVDGVKL